MGETEEPPRKRGRPSKPEAEKKKVPASSGSSKKGRGRPKGSKNKPKKVTPRAKGAKGRRSVKAAAEVEAD